MGEYNKSSNSGLNEVLEGKVLQESMLVRTASKLSRLSQHFGWPVLILFLIGPQSVAGHESLMIYFLIALPVAISSLVLRWWSFGYVRNEGFIIDGPYRYVRNPAELACVMAYTAGGVLLRLPTWYNLGAITVAILYISFVSIYYEDKYKRLYASMYLRYVQRVRRWIPTSLPAANPVKKDYQLSRAFLFDKRWWLWMLGYLFVFGMRYRMGSIWKWIH